MHEKHMQNRRASSALQTAIIAIAGLFGYMLEGHSADGDLLWYHSYGGIQIEMPFSLISANDGGWMVGAETNSFGAGFGDVWLIKIDAVGDCLWSQTYGDSYQQYARALIATPDGGWLLIANQYTFGPPTWLNAEVIRINERGDTCWTWLFCGDSDDELVAALPCTDGFLAAGNTLSLGAGAYDQWLVRLDDSGDTLWTNTWGGQYDEQTTHLLSTSDSGSLVIGTTSSFSQQGQTGISLWRSNDQGDSLWTRVYGDGVWNLVIDAVNAPDGGWLMSIIAPNHFGSRSGNDLWLLRLDANGDEVWSKFYGSSSNDYVLRILPLSSEGWLLAGTKSDTANVDTWLMKVDTNGDSLWSRYYGTVMDEWIVTAILTPDSGCLLAGSVYYPGTENSDWWILKTNAEGDSQWSMTFGDSLSGDFIRSLDLTPEGNYLIVGESHIGAVGYTDVGIMCLEGPSTGIMAAPTFQPYRFVLQKPHPNPFNATTAISYQLSADSHVNLRVYDTAGRLVETLVDGWRSAGRHQLTWDAANMPSGIYFARLEAGDYVGGQKMVLVK